MPRKLSTPKPKIVRQESDLSAPIQAYLGAQGYTVRCEVNSCDITAILGEELVVVELKKQFSTDLLIQAIDRQRIADSVYVALPAEGGSAGKDCFSKRWQGIHRLLKRLELGLMVVRFPANPNTPPAVEVALHPISENRARRKPRTRLRIIQEIAGREAGDHNRGGVSKKTILTAYREQAIFIACCMERYGSLSPKQLRDRGVGQKAQSILNRDLYGWFERLDRGLYALRPSASDIISENYSAIAAYYVNKLEGNEAILPEKG